MSRILTTPPLAATNRLTGLMSRWIKPPPCGVLQPRRRLTDVVGGRLHRQGAVLLHHLTEVHPLDVFHDQHLRVADLGRIEGGDHVRMRQLRGGVDLAAEASIASESLSSSLRTTFTATIRFMRRWRALNT